MIVMIIKNDTEDDGDHDDNDNDRIGDDADEK